MVESGCVAIGSHSISHRTIRRLDKRQNLLRSFNSTSEVHCELYNIHERDRSSQKIES